MSKKAPGAPPPPFVLWREALTAYAMPAVSAALGGVVTRQPQLIVAALTTIGGTSAVVAAALGALLRRRPPRSRPPRTPKGLAAAACGVFAAALGLAVGLAAAHWLPQLPALADSPWPGRLPVDLPLSSAIAATITTWRWRGSRPAIEPQHRLPATTRPERQTS
ncbi:hypothetical protein [Streptomyces sp. CBMA123]|uniref:hypothetical protein n=1 Tax=Streptomyces sp. CBMA123 TaxID=1896313 RepID=UPI00166199DE|nr:hypothetical protein [Streptomyces sp. CBMA123]MBD0693237.1 hypothetical protein [Streptomyces sp. CBMA123]